MDPDAYERLADLIKARRKERRLSVSAAARAAGIDRATWGNLESGARQLREYNYAGIETALSWAPGSIDAVLAGGAPTTLDEAAPDVTRERDEEIDLVLTDRNLDASMKTRIIELILQRRDRERAAAIEETRRMIDLFKGSRSA